MVARLYRIQPTKNVARSLVGLESQASFQYGTAQQPYFYLFDFRREPS